MNEFHLAQFLRAVAGTDPFRVYCSARGIRFTHARGDPLTRWHTAVSRLAPETNSRIEWELAEVLALSDPAHGSHLLEAADNAHRPPHDVPAGPALALWFFLHRPELFQGVLAQHEIRDDACWCRARTEVGLRCPDLAAGTAALGRELKAVFGWEGTADRFCVVEARQAADGIWFAARVADRRHVLEGFAEDGKPSTVCLHPVLSLDFRYLPAEGVVLLKSPLRAAHRLRDLFERFGRVVLGTAVACGGVIFHLDRLKEPFHPPPDADDMLQTRVRALHLRYPARLGRHLLKLETHAGAEATAIDRLLAAHAGDAETLTVTHAEIQVRLLVGDRPKNVAIRLWRDRFSLGPAALWGRLQGCLCRWGLIHG